MEQQQCLYKPRQQFGQWCTISSPVGFAFILFSLDVLSSSCDLSRLERSFLLTWPFFLCLYRAGLGITAGYHRLWSHRAYNASMPLQFFLMLGGSGAVEGSIRWWSRGHRAHHRVSFQTLPDTLETVFSHKADS